MSWTCLIVLFLVSFARAETSLSGEVGLSLGSFVPSESSLNPGNRIFENPNWDNLIDFRGQLKAESGRAKVILRPRWLGDSRTIHYSDTHYIFSRAHGSWDLTDAYVEWTPKDNWQFTTGLQVEGWGPAEFVNPTNPFFHLNLQSKSFFYKEKGHVLTKLVWNPTPKMTLALIGEPVSNNERSFRAGEDFHPQFAMRGEWQSNDASRLVGLIGGQDWDQRNYFGEYLQLRHDRSGFSVYWEGRHTKDPRRFEVQNQSGFQELLLKTEPGLKTYSVTGLRWEGRADIRAEWIHSDEGYSEEEWGRIVQSTTQLSPYLVSNAEKFSRPGLEFLTKNWWSFSVRWADVGPKSDWQWTNRVLQSLGDKPIGPQRSLLFQSDLEMPALQAWTFFLEYQRVVGQQDTELLLGAKEAYYLGARWAF